MTTAHNPAATPPGLKIDQGETIGLDPRRMDAAELAMLGHNSSSVLEAVRSHCIDCSGGEAAEARKCTRTACPLWPFRMGTNPLARRSLSDDQKAALRDRAAAARASRAARNA